MRSGLVSSQLGEGDDHDQLAGSQPPPLTGPVPAVLAHQLFQNAFRHVTGLADGDDPGLRMLRFDLQTLHTTSHRVLSHPYARAAFIESVAEFNEAVDALQRGPRLDPEEFSQRAISCVEERVGPFRSIGEREFAQLPLHVSEVTVADPVSLLKAHDAPITVTATGDDFVSARHRAALRAFTVYCSLCVDPRRVLIDDRGVLTGSSTPRKTLSLLPKGG